jgi:hypothetical protein
LLAHERFGELVPVRIVADELIAIVGKWERDDTLTTNVRDPTEMDTGLGCFAIIEQDVGFDVHLVGLVQYLEPEWGMKETVCLVFQELRPECVGQRVDVYDVRCFAHDSPRVGGQRMASKSIRVWCASSPASIDRSY